MSIEAMVEVLKYEVGDPTRKLVLLAHANHAHSDGTASWVGVDKVSAYAECSTRTVQRHVARLVADGFLREGDQRLVASKPSNRRPIVYDVAMSERDQQQWAVEAADGGGRREAAAQAGRRGSDKTNAARGDRLSPQESLLRGDTGDHFGATPVTVRGDTRVGETVLEPSLEPSVTTLGRAPRSTPPKSCRIPDDWAPDEALRQWTREAIRGTTVDPRREVEQFRDHWHAKSGRDATKADWPATWRMWIRNAVKYAGEHGPSALRLSEAPPSAAVHHPAYRPMREVLAEQERLHAAGGGA